MTTERFNIDIPSRNVNLHVRRKVSKNTTLAPLLLLHGWPASSAGWEAVVANLPDDRTYIFPDLRGLGDSQRIGSKVNYQKQELAADITALMTELNIEHFHLVGHDWGGAVAQELALTDKRVCSLTIMNIPLINNSSGSTKGLKEQLKSPYNPRWYIAFQSAPKLAENMIPGNEEIWIRHFLNQYAEGNSLPEDILKEYIRAYKIEGTAGSGANYYRALFKDYERWASLDGQKQTVPSLILYGAEDSFVVPSFYEGYENCFENVKRVDLYAGHFINDEIPVEVAHEINKFITSLS